MFVARSGWQVIGIRLICWCLLAGRRVIWPMAWLTREKCPITNRSLNDTVVRYRSHQASANFSGALLGICARRRVSH